MWLAMGAGVVLVFLRSNLIIFMPSNQAISECDQQKVQQLHSFLSLYYD